MPVLRNIGSLATCRNEGSQQDIHTINDAILVWKDETILWAGAENELPDQYNDWPSLDAGGNLVAPGLIDCHTHLCFAGWRADEFEMRIQGKDYLDIAKSGGGILSTVKETREATEKDLLERCVGFLKKMSALGVTTVECKSGYGLDTGQELKLLRIYQKLRDTQPTRIISTFLGAHTLPPEYKDDREAYIRKIIDEMIPSVAKRNLANFCDVFVEDTAFTIDEAREILNCGKEYGLRPKLHADQLSDGGGAILAAEVNAISADHLECISDKGIRTMANSGVCAVNLPFASLYLNRPFMPARKLIVAGVPVAIATDFNPGSAPSYDLPLAMFLACTLQRMTPAEVLKGATIYAAHAIGIENQTGSLEPGKTADFIIINAKDVNQWFYHYQPNACLTTYCKGRRLSGEIWE